MQPIAPHEHWHIDISYLNMCGTLYMQYFLLHVQHLGRLLARDCSSGNLREIAGDGYRNVCPTAGMPHVKTSPYYLQSNGKIERFHRTIKGDCDWIRDASYDACFKGGRTLWPARSETRSISGKTKASAS